MLTLTKRLAKATFKVAPDLIWIQFCIAAALWVASGETWPVQGAEYWQGYGGPILLASIATLGWRGIHRMNNRYLGLYDQINLTIVSIILTLAALSFSYLSVGQIDLAFPILFGFFTLAGLTGSRVVLRMVNWGNSPFSSRPASARKIRTLIVGAGDAGEFVLREMRRSVDEKRLIMGFVDDDPDKRSLIIQGVRVLGTTGDINKLTENLNLDEIIICVPSADGDTMRRINDICMDTNVRVRTLPSVSRMLHGPVNLRQHLRDVDVEDLCAVNRPRSIQN